VEELFVLRNVFVISHSMLPAALGTRQRLL
jgi:hypothetical protein